MLARAERLAMLTEMKRRGVVARRVADIGTGTGLLETQESAVRAAYRRNGFHLVARLVNGDWSILWLRRRFVG